MGREEKPAILPRRIEQTPEVPVEFGATVLVRLGIIRRFAEAKRLDVISQLVKPIRNLLSAAAGVDGDAIRGQVVLLDQPNRATDDLHCVADGVTQGLIGYATKDASGRLRLERLKESLFDADVEISDDVFILKPDEAQKLREPPRVAQLLVRPEHVVVKVGDQASFSCTAIDQYGQPIALNKVEWSAIGGSMDARGLFTAGDHGGAFTVKAAADGHEAHAEVRVTTKDEAATQTPPPQPGERYVRWRGSVPPQKWMNFYTKVLSKYATLPDLKLEVSFEAKVDRDHADSKASETKSALRELGLDDTVSSS